MMHNTAVRTNTFTITEARYVARKMMADLEIFRQYYGDKFVTVERIKQFAIEAEVLLNERCLNYVQFGLTVNGLVIFSINYTASHDGNMSSDHPPGDIPPHVDIQNAKFYSFLTYSPAYHALSNEERSEIHDKIPLTRISADEPVFSNSGNWDIAGKSYAKGGEGVKRNIFNG